MLYWTILLVFALPLIYTLIEIFSKKNATNKKLETVQKRLNELEKRKIKKESELTEDD